MYNNTTGAILPATGAGVALYWPLAGFALIALGFGLMRAARTFRRDEA